MTTFDAKRSEIPPETRLATVHLSVADLRRSVEFYTQRIGLIAGALAPESPQQIALHTSESSDEALLQLVEVPAARKARGTTGLYHFALLVPSRLDLAQSLSRLLQTETRLTGASDHGVSEALYLDDPDGNGIEIYRDRSPGKWPRHPVTGTLAMTTDALDLDALFDEASRDVMRPLAPATRMGHVHLHVSDLAAARRFYVDTLGFEVQQTYGPSALFVSAGGYHHHIGLNTWQGEGAPPPPADATGLRHFEIVLPDRDAVQRLRDRVEVTAETSRGFLTRDPSGNALEVRAS